MDKQNEVLTQIENLKRCVAEGKNISDIEKELNVYVGFFYDFLRRRVRRYVSDGSIDESLLTEYIELYQDCKCGKRKYSQSSSTEMDCDYTEDTEYSHYTFKPVELIRSAHDTYIMNNTPHGRIMEYVVNYRLNRQDFSITFSRDDMEMIHKSYSSDGENLTQKEVCRKFEDMDRKHLKKILYTLGITKASSPFPPHVFEENSIESIIEKTNIIKENAYHNRLASEHLKYLEKRNGELLSQINKLNSRNYLASTLELTNITPYIPTVNNNSKMCMYVYISDSHVGAYVDNRSIYSNPYNKDEFNKRLDMVIDEIKSTANSFNGFDKVVVCNLGDSLDGYDKKTTRGGHIMPQNMDNKEQFEVYTQGMIRFFESLNQLGVANQIDYICVGESNHGGDYDWAANVAVETYLRARFPSMYIQIFKKFIGIHNHGKHTFIITHGKDAVDMFKNMPLTLNDKTEKYLMEYIDSLSDVRKNIHIIKGDLHQSATNYNRKFRYKNVGSLFGSSKWIHHNFGNTRACFDYDIVDSTSDFIVSGRKELN